MVAREEELGRGTWGHPWVPTQCNIEVAGHMALQRLAEHNSVCRALWSGPIEPRWAGLSSWVFEEG